MDSAPTLAGDYKGCLADEDTPSSQFSGDYDDTSVGLVFITLWLFNSSPWYRRPQSK